VNYYSKVAEKRNDSEELRACVEAVVENLKNGTTSVTKPGMLLGKIQGGKTRAFIGVIAYAFDNDYDISIVLTKGTKALAKQTYERVVEDFSELIEDDKIQVFDIMSLPQNLTNYVLRQKLIFVAKKQKDNLGRIIKCLEETYPNLKQRKLLIVDDEADFASIGFTRTRNEGIELKKIATMIDNLRTKVEKSDFLQVTATPYSLYLQPEDIQLNDVIFKPIRPAFTVLLPIYPTYIGGDYYFKEEDYEETIDDYIYQEVPSEELGVLKKEDGRVFKIEEALKSKKIHFLRTAIINFIVGSVIRRIQQQDSDAKVSKYSFIVHTDIAKKTHDW